MAQRYREMKIRMMKENPHCHWCGIICVLYPILKAGESHKPDAATIDHVVSRYFREKGESVEKVLACWGCNINRSMEEMKKYGVNKKLSTHSLLHQIT